MTVAELAKPRTAAEKALLSELRADEQAVEIAAIKLAAANIALDAAQDRAYAASNDHGFAAKASVDTRNVYVALTSRVRR